MQNIKILSLVCNKLQALESHFFVDLKSLSYLYLGGNQLINIEAKLFQQNPQFRTGSIRLVHGLLCLD